MTIYSHFYSTNSGNMNHFGIFAVRLTNIYLSKATLHVSSLQDTPLVSVALLPVNQFKF